MTLVKSSFLIGFLFSAAASTTAFEAIRDRKLLNHPKFNNQDVEAYLYKMQLQSKINAAKDGVESGTMAEVRSFVNNGIVRNLQQSSNSMFSLSPIQSIKKMLE